MPIRAIVDNAEVFADNYLEGDIRCPSCNQEMIFVNPIARIIKHFRHKVECPYTTEPETIEHVEMKGFFKRNIPEAKIEVKIGNRIADVVVNDVVIECQVSDISLRELKERNEDYNRSGYYVLWVLHYKNYANELKQTKIIERYLQVNNYGRFYLFNGNDSLMSLHIIPIHYRHISPCEFCTDFGVFDQYYFCKKRKCWFWNKETERPYNTSSRFRGFRNSCTGEPITSFMMKKNRNGLASFMNDGKCFWKTIDENLSKNNIDNINLSNFPLTKTVWNEKRCFAGVIEHTNPREVVISE